MHFMDLPLARRLERTEGVVGSSFVAARNRATPEVRAVWRELHGTYAIYDGTDSPMTQTFGLGLFEAIAPESLSAIEAFFAERGADTMHEVSPLAGVELYAALAERGYRPSELSTVLVQPVSATAAYSTGSAMCARVAQPGERAQWVEASVRGWSEDPDVARIIRSLAEIAFANDTMTHFVVDRGGEPVATASLGVHDGVALLAGASTVPYARGMGAQGLLLAARLAEAYRRGCQIAMMVAAPGSASQRNAERRGFAVAYSRTKWRLPTGR